MKINLSKEIKKDTLVSHIVLHCLSRSILEKLIEKRKKAKDGVICEVKLTVDGYELNIQSLVKHWDDQMTRMVKEKAVEIVKEKFADIYDILADLEDRLKIEVEKRLEDWEKEQLEDWEKEKTPHGTNRQQ